LTISECRMPCCKGALIPNAGAGADTSERLANNKRWDFRTMLSQHFRAVLALAPFFCWRKSSFSDDNEGFDGAFYAVIIDV
jgi:hypothetical protein